MLTRRRQLLLRLLKIRLIIDGFSVFYIDEQPLEIAVKSPRPRVVITDGFHISKPQELVLQHMYIYYYQVACAIDDEQLVFGFVLLLLFYTAGITSGLLVLKILSFLPVLYFLFVYYFNRSRFLRLRPA